LDAAEKIDAAPWMLCGSYWRLVGGDRAASDATFPRDAWIAVDRDRRLIGRSVAGYVFFAFSV